jgi:hypothetical protein
MVNSCNKANSTLGFIRRNPKHCNKKFKETAYISLVRSVMDYLDTVWDPYLQKDIDRRGTTASCSLHL